MSLSKRSLKTLALLALGLMFLLPLSPSSVSADTVESSDFREKSFSKVVDWFDYVRKYAADNDFPCDLSCQNDHAYLYTNYINVGGFQLFYVGLVNATHNSRFVTIPLQTFFEHYKTPAGKTAVTASSFISLVAFKENTSSVHPNSPDRGDELYASFSLGVDLTAFGGRPVPPYVATSKIIPLTSIDDNHWTWGLNYTNLNAIWWRIGVDSLPYWDSNVPRGLARYSELTFTYDLTIDPSTKTAKLQTNYTVGKMTDLWLLAQNPVAHLNATGTYNLDGTLASPQTIYEFLQTGQYKLSIVLAQKAILVSQNTAQTPRDTIDGSNATAVDDSEHDVSRAAVSTEAPDGERVFRADFGTKPTYQLYDLDDSNPTAYDATTRTVRRLGWAGNPVFWFQNKFMGFLPLFVAHVDPALIQHARNGLVDFVASDYVYIISYQQWGGTKIVHDPDFTAFYQPSSTGFLTALFIAVAAAAAVGGVFAFLFRRRKANIAAGYPGQAPPGQGPAPAGPPSPSPSR